MRFTFTHGNKLLRLDSASAIELEQLKFLSSAKGYNFGSRKSYEVSFFHNFQYLPAGFWHKLLLLTKSDWSIEFTNLNSFIYDIKKDELSDWIESQDLAFPLYWYQLEAVHLMLKFPISKIEIGTGGGKSLVVCAFVRYVLQKICKPGQKVLIIVPRKMLVTQFLGDFKDYCQDNFLVCDSIFGGGKRWANSNVIIGTMQSLVNMDKEFFEDVGAVLIDECHTATTASIRSEIIPKLPYETCYHIHGLTGTMPDGSVDSLTLEAYLGPTLLQVETNDLKDEGAIVPVKINIIELTYSLSASKSYYFAEETQTPDTTRYQFEKQFVLFNQNRLTLINSFLERLDGNTVVLVDKVEYAQYLNAYFQNSETTLKNNHLIYGGTPDIERERIKQELTTGRNHVLFATLSCFSTGISIKNIMNIVFADGGKSRIRVRQGIGRGLRLHPEKEFLNVYDFCDILLRFNGTKDQNYEDRWPGPRINIYAKQSKERIKIYQDQKMPFEIKKFSLC